MVLQVQGPDTRGDMDLDTRKGLACVARHLEFTLWKKEPCWVYKQGGTFVKLSLFLGVKCRGEVASPPTGLTPPLPGSVHVGACQHRPWNQLELTLNDLVCPKSRGLSGQAPLLQASLFPDSAKEGTILWKCIVADEPLGTRFVNCPHAREEARETGLAEDLKRKGVALDETCSSWVLEGSFSHC